MFHYHTSEIFIVLLKCYAPRICPPFLIDRKKKSWIPLENEYRKVSCIINREVIKNYHKHRIKWTIAICHYPYPNLIGWVETRYFLKANFTEPRTKRVPLQRAKGFDYLRDINVFLNILETSITFLIALNLIILLEKKKKKKLNGLTLLDYY